MITRTLLAFAFLLWVLWACNRVAQWSVLRYVEGVLWVAGGGASE